MRRWNGWGDESVHYPLPHAVADLLAALLGPASAPGDTSFADAVASVPRSRLRAHPALSVDAAERVRHARGQSFPDLLALRSGQIGVFPDGVAYPRSAADVRDLLNYATNSGARLIPYGGGTSVVGHVNPPAHEAPLLTVDMRRMNRMRGLSRDDQLATFEAGVSGPDLEAQLRAHGYTLGHYPQSFEQSTLGGWIATRSRGQQSLGYGRIEQMFAGGQVETPAGSLALPAHPASATGPELRELVLGSEGRLGFVTAATLRVTPLAACEQFHAVFFPDWAHATSAVRQIAQSGAPLSMLRLSAPTETAMNFALSSHQRELGLLKGLLSLRGIGPEASMLLLGFSGSQRQVALSRALALDIARQQRGVHVGTALGRQWQRGRFRAPYLRDELWVRGYAVDTVETATTWGNVTPLMEAVERALAGALADQAERVHVFTHLSHVYPQGSSVYTTFLFRLGDPERALCRWQRLKAAATAAIQAHGGTLSHQHGIGRMHQPYLEHEKGALGLTALGQVFATYDPDHLLNPGALL